MTVPDHTTASPAPDWRLGVDTGGTFTDFVCLGPDGLCTHKVLSTPGAPEQAILQGIHELGLDDAQAAGRLTVVHGSTVATNAALERKGVRTVYVTNRGFTDTLTLGRQARPAIYDLTPPVTPPPVPPEHCLGVSARLDAAGHSLVEPDPDELAQLARDIEQQQPEAVAINLLFSFLNDCHERAIEAVLPDHLFVSRSSAVLPEYREYERGMATWLNAWLGPLMQRYLQRLAERLQPSPLTLMQSSGGTLAAAQAADRAVNLLLSGPAGGLAAARAIAQQTGLNRLLTFDMGGTSTDVALVLDGDVPLTTEGRIGPWPVAVPMVDMHTIGAGGGSLAHRDAGGLLHVGPTSAGADPGPAAYGTGGTEPTVTDAHVVLGRLPAHSRLGGTLRLHADKARAAIAPLAAQLNLSVTDTADGIVRLANEHMARALRVVSAQRGHDPKTFSLCCFGGAGGLHVCDLAEALDLREAIVPALGGVFSAFGLLVAPRERQLSRSWLTRLDSVEPAAIDNAIDALRQEARQALAAEGLPPETLMDDVSADLRYEGQSGHLTRPWQGPAGAADDFHAAHRDRYGHALDSPVELVTLRVRVRAPTPPLNWPAPGQHTADESDSAVTPVAGLDAPVPVRPRTSLPLDTPFAGPLVVTEATASTWVAPGWTVRRDAHGHLRLHRSG